MPYLDSYEKIAKTGASPSNKEKNKLERKGTLKILKIHRNSRAELRIWPSSNQVMKSFTNESFVFILSNRERTDY
jgi:preprotein translocase subunit SecE